MTDSCFQLIYESQKMTPMFMYEVKRVAEGLQELAPSDASLKMHVIDVDEGHLVTCRIVSYAGEFLAQAKGYDEKVLLQSIRGQILEQLAYWKGQRFGPPPAQEGPPLAEAAS